MDASTQRRSLIAFYFGTKVATADVTSAEVVSGASRKAYADLQRTLRGFGTHPARKGLKEGTQSSIWVFVDALDLVDTQEEFDQAHKEWCLKTCAEFEKHLHSNRDDFEFHYGQAQKWLNMTLKYLAVLDHPGVQRVYPFLHVPVDRYVYSAAAQEGVKIPGVWSTLDCEEYIAYQEDVRNMVKTAGKFSCPLDWEANVWVIRDFALAN
ncbi:hypothetical protein [Corynebacterium qintianiae]|uniref:hypothetical protein n=1 Tax=Corynebacterium qintianiae TaxID=2709392 RepID=UPI0013E9C96A|nr:hypothetical protein [Corynebacterium qintianiae]